jgi:hypothetical protein
MAHHSLRAPGSALMAALTNGKVIAAKSAFTVMTCQATLPATRGVMIERFRCGHLSPLRHTRAHLMTFITSDLLMLRVIKPHSKSLRKGWCA